MNKNLLLLAAGLALIAAVVLFVKKTGCHRKMKGRRKGTEWPPENGRL